MTKIKTPSIINNVFSESEFQELKNMFINVKQLARFESSLSRYLVDTNESSRLKIFASSLTSLARKVFESETLLPSYALFAHYEGHRANLHKHKDDNACTYTIDMCVYQKIPWDLYVEGVPYTLHPNQALAYYGNDQEHWREEFPEPKTNHVAMIFFHFVEPDHWWFTHGVEYLNVIRANTSMR